MPDNNERAERIEKKLDEILSKLHAHDIDSVTMKGEIATHTARITAVEAWQRDVSNRVTGFLISALLLIIGAAVVYAFNHGTFK